LKKLKQLNKKLVFIEQLEEEVSKGKKEINEDQKLKISQKVQIQKEIEDFDLIKGQMLKIDAEQKKNIMIITKT